MSRLALPQNYIKSYGTLLEDFETLSSFSAADGGSKEADTVNFKTGTQSMKLTNTSGSTYVIITKTVSWKLVGLCREMGMWVYCHTDPSTTLSGIRLYVSSAPYTKYYQYDYPNTQLQLGWNFLRIAAFDWANTSEDWANTMTQFKIRVNVPSGQICSISFDSWYGGITGIPGVMVMFDDGLKSVYSAAYPYMEAKGIKGTAYAVKNYIGANDNLYMNVAQLTAMYEDGWAIGNHTADHLSLSGLTVDEAIERIQPCTEYLDTLGFTRSSKHVAYPFGNYDANVISAMTELGYTSGRKLAVSPHYRIFTPESPDLYHIKCYSVPYNASLATVIGKVEQAINSDSSICILFHVIDDVVTDSHWTIANFQAFIDYLVARKVRTYTIDEWINGLTNPRRLVSR